MGKLVAADKWVDRAQGQAGNSVQVHLRRHLPTYSLAQQRDPAQQDLLPLECVNHVSHTVALITARYVIAFILMCYFPAARP